MPHDELGHMTIKRQVELLWEMVRDRAKQIEQNG